jgi:DNA-binding CsgD family transcriptional regulator
MLAYVGGFSEETFSMRDKARLQLLVPTLEATLRNRKLLDEAGWARSGMEAAMAALDAPAMLVDGRGRILHENPQAEAAWLGDGADRVDLSFLERPGTAPVPPGFELIPVRASGLPPLFLVIGRVRDGSDSAKALQHFACEHRLTRRQREVLRHLVDGQPNAAIAELLGCALRTVEAHVSNLLRRTGCDTRTELVAAALRSGR